MALRISLYRTSGQSVLLFCNSTGALRFLPTTVVAVQKPKQNEPIFIEARASSSNGILSTITANPLTSSIVFGSILMGSYFAYK